MATRADVRRIALSLPKAVEAKGHFAFSVPNKRKLKGFAWVWMEPGPARSCGIQKGEAAKIVKAVTALRPRREPSPVVRLEP